MIEPGATIGILGGGQLGRMTAMAAARLGYRAAVLASEADCPAADVARWHLRAAYDDPMALAELAGRAAVVTLEFENVPVAAVEQLAALRPVRPGAEVLRITQDRLLEKRFAASLGIATAPFARVDRAADLSAARARLGAEMILKTRRMGYDGKGQIRLDAGADAAAAAAGLGGRDLIAEALIAFEREISVVVARSPGGEVRCFPPVENLHRDQILVETRAPADLPPAVAEEAAAIACRLAGAIGLEGLLAVEMFLCQDGRLLVNELAPRPHNSGHWSLDACAVSQFEQLVRAICDLPLGSTEIVAPAVMRNLIGDEVDAWPTLLAEPGARLHLYGKAETRPGRKMGHVTRLLAPQAAVPGLRR